LIKIKKPNEKNNSSKRVKKSLKFFQPDLIASIFGLKWRVIASGDNVITIVLLGLVTKLLNENVYKCKIINSYLDLSDHKPVMVELKCSVDNGQAIGVDDVNLEHSRVRRFH